jgi:hypothetical protein
MYDNNHDDGPRGVPTLQWGLLFGIVLTVATIGGEFFLRSINVSKLLNPDTLDGTTLGLVLWWSVVSVCVELACCAGAGFLTARDTGSIGGGAFAGGVVLFTSIFVSGIISFALALTSPAQVYLAAASYASHSISAQQVAGAGLLGSVCDGVCCGLGGALIGALGALPARLIWGPPDEY